MTFYTSSDRPTDRLCRSFFIRDALSRHLLWRGNFGRRAPERFRSFVGHRRFVSGGDGSIDAEQSSERLASSCFTSRKEGSKQFSRGSPRDKGALVACVRGWKEGTNGCTWISSDRLQTGGINTAKQAPRPGATRYSRLGKLRQSALTKPFHLSLRLFHSLDSRPDRHAIRASSRPLCA